MMLLIDWLCLFAFFALLVEIFLGALSLIERRRR